jgi:hypothetical protein
MRSSLLITPIVSAALALAGAPIAFAQQVDAQKPPADEEIVVFGHSQTREAQSLKLMDMVKSLPGDSP